MLTQALSLDSLSSPDSMLVFTTVIRFFLFVGTDGSEMPLSCDFAWGIGRLIGSCLELLGSDFGGGLKLSSFEDSESINIGLLFQNFTLTIS